MSFSNDFKNYKEYKPIIYNNNKSDKIFEKRIDLIKSIPKLNFQGISNLNSKSKILFRSRNNKITFDKSLYNLSRNKIISNLDTIEGNKYGTDYNLNINGNNNIFDMDDFEKYNNSTTIETKDILSHSNNLINKKKMINKTIRKKRIINLKSFINDSKVKSRNKFILNKFINIFKNIYEINLMRRSFRKLLKYQENKILSKINNEGEKNNIISYSQIKLLNKSNNYYNSSYSNSMSDSNSGRNYIHYIDKISSRCNREREKENILTIIKYRPTNISFVLNHFSNNTIFNNIQDQLGIFKNQCKMNNEKNINQIKLFKKYYGDVEAINEEENESEEIKINKSSKRSGDNYLKASHNNLFQPNSYSHGNKLYAPLKKLLSKNKLYNNKNIIDKRKSKTYIFEQPNKDTSKFNLNKQLFIFNSISKNDIIRNKNKHEKYHSYDNEIVLNEKIINIPMKNDISNVIHTNVKKNKKKIKSKKTKEINQNLNENYYPKLILGFIILLSFIIHFFSKYFSIL